MWNGPIEEENMIRLPRSPPSRLVGRSRRSSKSRVVVMPRSPEDPPIVCPGKDGLTCRTYVDDRSRNDDAAYRYGTGKEGLRSRARRHSQGPRVRDGSRRAVLPASLSPLMPYFDKTPASGAFISMAFGRGPTFLEGDALDPLRPCARELQPALQVGQNHVSCLQLVADGSRVGSAYSLTPRQAPPLSSTPNRRAVRRSAVQSDAQNRWSAGTERGRQTPLCEWHEFPAASADTGAPITRD